MHSLPLVKFLTPTMLLSAPHPPRVQLMDYTDTYGAVLLRGFVEPVNGIGFSGFVKELGLCEFKDTGESAAPRTYVAPSVWTANEAPPDAVIPFHHEMAQSAKPPVYVAFFCERPPVRAGRTPLVRSRDVASNARKKFPRACRELEERGIRYVRYLPLISDITSPIGKSWTETFNTSSRDNCERRMRNKDMEWEWNGDVLKTISSKCDVFAEDSIGRETFFNSAVAAREGWNDVRNNGSEAIIFADGAPLNAECRRMFDDSGAFMSKNAVRNEWKGGDILLLDNRQVLHGREPFDMMDRRRVLASLWGKRQ